jgi:ribose transport system substrate-binding protein
MQIQNWRRRRHVGVLAAGLIAVALLLAACGGDDDSGSSGSSSSGSSSTAKKFNMTLIAGVRGDEFYITMNCGAQAEAKKLGATLNFQGPNEFAADQQIPIVNAVAAKKPDAVLIAPTDTKALFAPINQLADGGSKVVLVDTTLEQPDMAVSEIASDNEGGGKVAAETLTKLIGGSGKVFVNNVKPGISTTDARAKGFEEGAKAAGLTYVGQQYNGDDPAKAAAITKSILAKHPDLKGIFATNLFSAEGAAAGVREAGKQDQV